MERKDPKLAALLGFLLGGFGLFYVSAVQGIVALVILVAVAVCSGGVAAPVAWVGCGLWGYVAAQQYNQEHGLTGDVYGKLDEPSRPDGAASSFRQPSDTSSQRTATRERDGNVEGRDQYCGNCGAELRDQVSFCTSCGEEVR